MISTCFITFPEKSSVKIDRKRSALELGSGRIVAGTCLSKATQAGLSPPRPFGYTLVFLLGDWPSKSFPPIPGLLRSTTAKSSLKSNDWDLWNRVFPSCSKTGSQERMELDLVAYIWVEGVPRKERQSHAWSSPKDSSVRKSRCYDDIVSCHARDQPRV